MSDDLLVLPGDGIGPSVVSEARKILEWIQKQDSGVDISIGEGILGGASIDEHGEPLIDSVLEDAKQADGILLGAVGGPKWDDLPVEKRPEKALLTLREECKLFANLRPIKVYPELVDSSPLKNEVVSGADLLIVRELTGGIYFSTPRGIENVDGGKRGFNTLSYTTEEIRRITEVAVDAAREREGKLTSVDKANVLESSQLWRETVVEIVPDDIELNHFYVDNAVMQLIGDPLNFDVLVTGNLFGDILSDAAAQISGSIGLLPSASLRSDKRGMYEPVHGSAPDIAGEQLANPTAMILSLAMAFRYSFGEPKWADRIEQAVEATIRDGARTADLAGPDENVMSTGAMGDEILGNLKALS